MILFYFFFIIRWLCNNKYSCAMANVKRRFFVFCFEIVCMVLLISTKLLSLLIFNFDLGKKFLLMIRISYQVNLQSAAKKRTTNIQMDDSKTLKKVIFSYDMMIYVL